MSIKVKKFQSKSISSFVNNCSILCNYVAPEKSHLITSGELQVALHHVTAGQDENVLTYNDLNLKQIHIDSLLPNEFLYGDIIDFYLQYIWKEQMGCNRRVLFMETYTTHIIKESNMIDAVAIIDELDLEEKDIIVFPINNASRTASGTHWMLLVYSRKDNAMFFLVSSSHAENNLTMFGIDQFVRLLNLSDELKIQPCLRQRNNDCGYTCFGLC